MHTTLLEEEKEEEFKPCLGFTASETYWNVYKGNERNVIALVSSMTKSILILPHVT